MSEEQISCLIGGVYDAALEPELWPSALGGLCRFVGGSMANIFWQDVVGKAAKKFFEWGNDPHYTQLYMEKYARLNPLFPAAYSFPVGDVFSQSEVMPFEELRETRIYKEWMKPQGYIDFIGCHLDKSATSCVPTTVIRHERDGMVDDEAMARMRLIVPHVRRAALIGNVINLRSCEAATLADALDGLAAGLFLVDEAGRIVHVNRSGRAMLEEGEILRTVGARLTANAFDADRILREVFSAAGLGDAAVGVKGVAVSLQSPNGEHYVAHVLPLTAGARRRAGSAYAAVAAVFVDKAALEAPSTPDALAKAFGLTAMELRVLLGIVQIGGGRLVAQDLGIAETTVRTHLKHLFEKTGTNRQVDLVKLVAAFESPFAGSFD
jgi:DNA-binding CsgD family transcriptional regulator/PAS domain-containing protein